MKQAIKVKKLLLIQDRRGLDIVHYKEFVGHKVFLKEPKDGTTKEPLTFVKTLTLLDVATQTYRKQKVYCEVITNTGKTLVIGVK